MNECIHKAVSFLFKRLRSPVNSRRVAYVVFLVGCSELLMEEVKRSMGRMLTLCRFLYITYTKPGPDADPSPPSSAEVKNRVV
jgi:hypothetical protein